MPARIADPVVLSLIAQIYDAATDPALWAVFLRAFAAAVAGRATFIYGHNVDTMEASTDSTSGAPNAAVDFDPGFLKSLSEHYNFVNVWAQNEAMLTAGRPVTGSMLYPVRELTKTEFYNDWLRPQEFFHALGGIVSQEGPWAIKFSCLRSPRAGDFSATELRLYRELVPHLARAASIQRRFAFLQDLSRSSLGVLDAVPAAVMLLDGKGRVLHVNAAAEIELRRADPLKLHPSGELRTRGLPGARRALRNAIVAALDPLLGAREKLDTIARLARRNGALLSVQALPLPQRDRQAAVVTSRQQLAACALILHTGASPPPGVGPTQLHHVYGLTASESKVALALARGLSGKEACFELAISYNTLKTHLKRIYSKTQTKRQSDLVRLLAAGLQWKR